MDDGYAGFVDDAWERVRPLIEKKLDEIGKEIKKKRENVKIIDHEMEGGDEYGIGIDVDIDGCTIAIRSSLLEELVREGTDNGSNGGLSFEMTVTARGNVELAGYVPYNYTKLFWTSDVIEIERRIEAIEPMMLASQVLSEFEWRNEEIRGK
jgi:hypothetical protein